MNHFKGLNKSKDDAVWQYLLDHATPSKKGHKISFYIRYRAEWESKILSRMKGNYRNDERKLEEKLEKQCKEYEQEKCFEGQYYRLLKITEDSEIKKNKLLESNNIYIRLISYLYKNIENGTTN